MGFVLSAVSVIWGVTHELTTKDEDNKRHLTRAGRYSVALTLLGLLISVNTGVLKFVVDNQTASRQAQEDAIKEQRQRDDARKTQEKIDREAQEGRSRALEAKQRVLALSQQQIQGFNTAERFARLRTLNQLQRLNHILSDTQRAQYQFPLQMLIQAGFSVSIDHASLKNYSSEIEATASRLFELDKSVGFSDRSLSVSPVNYLFKHPNGMPQVLTNTDFDLHIFKKGTDWKSPNVEPDLKLVYTTPNFDVKRSDGAISFASEYYSIRRRSYVIDALPSLSQQIYSSGRITSILDLAGATLEIVCNSYESGGLDRDKASGCSHISLQYLRIEFPSGITLILREEDFHPEKLFVGRTDLVHRFNSDEKSFLERYGLK